MSEAKKPDDPQAPTKPDENSDAKKAAAAAPKALEAATPGAPCRARLGVNGMGEVELPATVVGRGKEKGTLRVRYLNPITRQHLETEIGPAKDGSQGYLPPA